MEDWVIFLRYSYAVHLAVKVSQWGLVIPDYYPGAPVSNARENLKFNYPF